MNNAMKAALSALGVKLKRANSVRPVKVDVRVDVVSVAIVAVEAVANAVTVLSALHAETQHLHPTQQLLKA